ncbi:MAG: dihydroneopterin aldolase [Nitrospirales bacterium]
MKKNAIIIKAIQVSANCGVSEAERARKQPLLVDIRFRCPNQTAFHSDKLSDTVDYGAIIRRVRDVTENRTFALLETLTEQLCHILFQEFPLTHLQLWVRKIQPPLEGLQGSVGVQVARTRSQQSSEDDGLPSEFLVAQLPRLPAGKALDVAAGRGRHSVFLVSKQFTVHAVDRDSDALSSLQDKARRHALASLTTQIMDLESDPSNPPDLGHESYDVILVFFYLYRPLFPKLLQALKPGGMLLYETFLIDNHLLHRHPRRKEFCLGRNELLDLIRGLRVLHYEEGLHDAPAGPDGAITARMLAQKPD